MNNIVEIVVNQWDELSAFSRNLSGYAFRGQSDCKWPLSTSLERCLAKYHALIPMAENNEYWTLHEFKRKSHLYADYHPNEEDNVEWLSIMQHYGCPTRLLDFTNSWYAAAFFAIIESDTDAAIWALNELSLRDRVRNEFKLPYAQGDLLKDEINLEHLKLANLYCGRDAWQLDKLFLIPIVPKKLTDRISRQQGLFFFPTKASHSFMENMSAAYALSSVESFNRITLKDLSKIDLSYMAIRPDVLKFVLPKKLHPDIIRNLSQMNITSESLFGGLDGLAKSVLQSVIRYKP